MNISGIPPDISVREADLRGQRRATRAAPWTSATPTGRFGNVEYHGECVPVPAGTAAAAGTDGHLMIVSADRTRAWAFWRCKMGSDSGAPCNEANVLAGRLRAANMAVWDLTGDGSPTAATTRPRAGRARRSSRPR